MFGFLDNERWSSQQEIRRNTPLDLGFTTTGQLSWKTHKNSPRKYMSGEMFISKLRM
jgi:hypothetical protein